MRRAPWVLSLAILCQGASGNARAVRRTALPVLVLQVERPWQGHLMRQAPELVVYDSHLAIQRHFVATGPDEYSSAILDNATFARLTASARTLVGDATWEPWYEPQPHPSDQPTTRVLVQLGNVTVATAVHGRFACQGGARTGVPDGLCRLISELGGVRLSNGKTWVPERVDVALVKMRGKPTVAWPADWPVPKSGRGATGDEEQVTIELNGGKLADLETILKPTRGNGIVAMDGKTWFAAYAVPYPSEAVWQAKFQALAPQVRSPPPNFPLQTGGASPRR